MTALALVAVALTALTVTPALAVRAANRGRRAHPYTTRHLTSDVRRTLGLVGKTTATEQQIGAAQDAKARTVRVLPLPEPDTQPIRRAAA